MPIFTTQNGMKFAAFEVNKLMPMSYVIEF